MKKLIPSSWPNGTPVDSSWVDDVERGHILMVAKDQLLQNAYRFISQQLLQLPAEYRKEITEQLQSDFRGWDIDTQLGVRMQEVTSCAVEHCEEQGLLRGINAYLCDGHARELTPAQRKVVS